MKFIKEYRCEFLSGILMGAAHHPIQLGFLAWVGLIPFLLKQAKISSLKRTLFSAYIWGFTYYLVLIYWLAFNIGTIRVVAFFSMLASVSFLALSMMLIIFLWHFSQKRLWLLPLIWVSVEYIRTFGSLGFPWGALANSQTDYLLLIQNAEITGIYGISFWIVMLNAAGVHIIRNVNLKSVMLFMAVLIFPWFTGILLKPDVSKFQDRSIAVAIIQPNIELSQKWKNGATGKNIRHLLDLSKPYIEKNIDLIIWPETAPGSYILKKHKKYLSMIHDELEGHPTVLLTGVPHYELIDNEYETYNAVALIDAEKVVEIYEKILLVPMAEYIPLSDIFPGLKKLNLGQANFTQGEDYTIFKAADFSFGSGICFESTFPQFTKNYVKNGAEFIVFVVNDGWYETAPEPQQHASQVIYRAIESRSYVIRCANTGISMLVDPAGNITHQIMLNDENVIEAQIYPNQIKSFYVKFGDVFAHLMMVFTVISLVYFLVRKNDTNNV